MKNRPLTLSSKTCIVVVFFITTLILTGFRWDVGIDWQAYYSTYGGAILNNSNFAEKLEPFNLVTCALLQSNGFSDGRYWLWGMALINLFFFTKSLVIYSKNIILSIFLYLLIGFYFDSLNMVRQACSISIGLYSWQFIGRNIVKFYITIGLAILFHTSAILLLPIYYIYRLKISKTKLKLIVLISVIIAPISTIIAPKLILALPFYQQYADTSVLKYISGSGNILSYIRMIFPIFLMCLTIDKWNVLEKSTHKTLAMIISCGLLLNIAFPTTQLIIRMSFYFTIGLVFYIPIIFNYFSKKNRQIFWMLSILYYSLFLSINYLFSPVAKIIPFNLRFDIDFLKLFILSTTLICVLMMVTYLIKPLPTSRKNRTFYKIS